MTCVYQHRRLDTGNIFYVGIGQLKNRSISTKSRNPYWRNIVRKTTVVVEIIGTFEKREDACLLEKKLIKQYKKISEGGTLCNITDGGDGGVIPRLCKKVECFDRNISYINTYDTIRLASRIKGVDHSHIIDVCKGRRKTAGGYIWKYK